MRASNSNRSKAKSMVAIGALSFGMLAGGSLAWGGDRTLIAGFGGGVERPFSVTEGQYDEFSDEIDCSQLLTLDPCVSLINNCVCDPSFTWQPPGTEYIVDPSI